MKELIEVHQFNPLYREDSNILILGSFPSVKSRENNFYYMHPRNRFWGLLTIIFNDDFSTESIDKKRQLLKKHHIALYDVIKSCKIHASSDSSIEKIEVADIRKILKQTQINRIFLNGRKAESIFKSNFPDLVDISYYLPSSSPANAKYSIDDLYDEWKIMFDK